MLAIVNIVFEPEGAAAAVEAGAVPPLAEQLCSGNTELQGLAAGSLKNITADSQPRQQAVLEQPGALASLVSLLGSSDTSDSTSSVCSREGGSGGSSHAGVLSISVSTSAASRDVAMQAAGAVHNLAEAGPQACRVILAAGAVPPLVHLLLSRGYNEALWHAILALRHLMQLAACRSQLLEAGAVSALQHIQQGGAEKDVRDLAGSLLQQLTGPVDTNATAPADHQVLTATGAAGEAPAAAPPPAPPARPSAPRVCAAPGCGTTTGLRRCGGCGTMRYCSEACCKAHWRAHKAECRRLQAEQAAAGAAAPGASSAQ